MKWILYTVVSIVVLIGVVFLMGYALPAKTTVSRSVTLHQPPSEVFAALADVQKLPQWNRNTEKVELAPSVNGKETTKQTFKSGMTMTLVTAESAPPRHLVRTMGDEGGPFAGSWTYEITSAEGGGSTIVLTEVAEFMTRIFGQTKYIDEHLEDLAKKFGETTVVR